MRYKAITTISFNFDSDEPPGKAMEYARKKLSEILDDHPQGEDFSSYSAQLNLVRLKDKHKLKRIGEFPVEEVLPYITTEDIRRIYTVNGKDYPVRMNSDRYFVFLKSLKCCACGIEGTRMMLELNPGDDTPHFNLYAEDSGRLVLMTKDHIIAKSRGGENSLNNYQSMCAVCNNLKANHNLSIEAVRELREVYDNNAKLPKRDLKKLINNRRQALDGFS